MDQVASELSVVPAMCQCQKHHRHSLAHAHIPPTSNPQIHKYGYRSKEAPHLQTPPKPQLFSSNITYSPQACTLTYMDVDAQVYEQTSDLCRHAQKETHTYGVQLPPPIFWRSANMPRNLSTGNDLAQKHSSIHLAFCN